jgi:hypothetical protein
MVRILGKFNRESYLVYPTFSMADVAHGCDAVDCDDRWTYWLSIDPGRTVCAVLCMAIPPPHVKDPDQRFAIGELYLKNCTAEMFADHVKANFGHLQLQGMLIDPSAVKQDVLGGGKSVFQQYAEALQARGISCRNSGSHFNLGNNDVSAGILAVQSFMYNRAATNTPRLKVLVGRCPNLVRELSKYRRQRDANGVILDKVVARNDHLCDTLRYFCMANPRWQPAPAPVKRFPIYEAYQAWEKAKDAMDPNADSIVFGPSMSQR